MSKKNKKTKVVDIYTQPIFSIHQIVVIISNNPSDITKTIQTTDNSKIDVSDCEDFEGLTYSYGYKYKGKLCVCIYIHPSIITDSIENVASHEALHAATGILSFSDIQHAKDTEEVYAYTIGWITECVINSYKKWLKK